jgi:hypothetical protein|tara:strand:- start:215 stop:934 length:720 start_codon:yes stop_codon:yes gene_type:complete
MSYKLLSQPNSNPKVKKGNTKDSDYITTIMHLRPVSTRICPYQDIAKCKTACLNTAGLGGVYPSIQKSRQAKTDLFLNDRDTFMAMLYKDIEKFVRFCEKKNKKPAVRLNGTSDIQWETIKHEGVTAFEKFPQVQFYDYTKIPTRKISHIPNYHLTWSYSEANQKYANYFDKLKYNIAVVFSSKTLPPMFKGLRVIDGDKTDMRFLDGNKRVVVGLKAKGKAKTDTSGFVIHNLIRRTA